MSLSLIIPSYNFQDYVKRQFEQLLSSRLAELALEIIFVDDGSTDETANVIQHLISAHPEVRIKLISLETNQGRFKARLIGAHNAIGDKLFFIDSRISIPPQLGDTLNNLISEEYCLVANIHIDETLSPFNLYWKRTHEWIFADTFKSRDKPLIINADNFMSQLTGTGALVVDRKLFVKHCEGFQSIVLSDDNALLEKIVREKPILIHPDFFVYWEPRQKLFPFVMRILERGPGFIEFHYTQKNDRFRLIVNLGLLFLILWLITLLTYPSQALLLAAGVILIFSLSTILFTQSLNEFVRLAHIHTLTLIFFSCGIIHGLLLHLKKNARWRSN